MCFMELIWQTRRTQNISSISLFYKDWATIHPDIKHTLVAMSDRNGMSISQVTDEVLYTGLIEMYELEELEE